MSTNTGTLTQVVEAEIKKKNSLSVDTNDPLMRTLTEREDPKSNELFKKKFGLPTEEHLIKVFSAALLKGNILHHGRLYVSENWVCFHANIFGHVTTERIPMGDITSVKKVNLGLQITTESTKYLFASFFSRDKAYLLLMKRIKKSANADGKTEDSPDSDLESKDEEDGENWADVFISTEDEEAGFLKGECSSWTQIINEEIPCSLLRFFKLFFSDSQFTEYYHKLRGDSEITIGNWTTSPEFGSTREVQYRAPLNHPIGPSSARCEETQRYYLSKKSAGKNGIPRWPHRKIKSLDKMIANLEVNLSKNPNEKEEINNEVELLKTKKQEIMKNPDILVTQSMSRVSGNKLGISSNNMKKTNKVRPVLSPASIAHFQAVESREEDQDSIPLGEHLYDRYPTNNNHLPDFHLQQLRRASLPNFEPKFPIIPSDLPSPNNTINLPPPVRRHSMDSLLTPRVFTLSPSTVHSPPEIVDLSQKLPDFTFPGSHTAPSCSLPCIQPLMQSNIPLEPKNTFPDWFLAEKNRVLGRD